MCLGTVDLVKPCGKATWCALPDAPGFRRGARLGKYDHLVTWHKPARPEWMDQETYALIPKRLTLREIRYNVIEPGKRTEKLWAFDNLRRRGSELTLLRLREAGVDFIHGDMARLASERDQDAQGHEEAESLT